MAKSDAPHRPPVRKNADWKNFVAGGVGGCMGAILTCPLEVVKTRFQALNYKPVFTDKPSYVPSFVQAFRTIVAKEGAKGLFKGLGPNLVGVAPSRAIYFGVYSIVKAETINAGFDESSTVHLLSAMTAGAAVATITSPIWLIKTRMQLQSDAPTPGHTNYKNSFDCVRRVYHEEGVRGFYKGLGASYLGISESSINFVLYEKFKSMILARRNHEIKPELSNAEYLITAAAAKFIASMLTYPHEVVRTRLREQRAPVSGPNKYTGIIQALRLIAKEEGMAGLYGGMTAHLLRVVPNAAIMFWTYEFIIKHL